MKYLIALCAVASLSLPVVGLAIPIYKAYATQETVTAVIEDRERIQDRNSSRYLIWTDGEVFENVDTLLRGKFNSSDIYGDLTVGATCELDVVGWRIPYFSAYRNIIAARCEPAQ